MTPTQRSLKHMRDQGYTVDIAEHWQAFAKKRRDLFTVIDWVCLGDNETVGVQTTSLANVSARVKKISECEHLGALRKAGWRLLVQGWGKGKDGKYRLREVDVS
jgi:hypothetical protein